MRIEELIGAGSGIEPEIGMKCTLHYYSDSHAGQIVKVSASKKTIWIRRNVVTIDEKSSGEMGHQDWVIHENEFMKVIHNYKTFETYKEPVLIDTPDDHSFFKVTLRKDGKYRTVGSDIYVGLGNWHEYYDWSF